MQRYLTIRQFMDRTQLSRATVWRMRRDGEIQATEVRGRVLIPLKAANEWEARQKQWESSRPTGGEWSAYG